jgi:hypothetical protein
MHQRTAHIGVHIARQGAEPGLQRIDALDAGGKAVAAQFAGDEPRTLQKRLAVLAHQHDDRRVVAEGHQRAVGVADGRIGLAPHQQGVFIHIAALGAEHLGEEAAFLLLPAPPLAVKLSLGIVQIEIDHAGRVAVGKPQMFQHLQMVGRALRGETFQGHAGDELFPDLGRVAGPQLLTANDGVEIHGTGRNIEAVQEAGQAEMQIVHQLVLPVCAAGGVCPGDGAEGPGVQPLANLVEQIAEGALELRQQPAAGIDRRRAVVVVIDEVGKLLLAPQGRRPHHHEDVFAFEMSAFGAEAAPALLIDHPRDGIGEMGGFGRAVASSWQTHGVDPGGIPAPQTRQRRIDVSGVRIALLRRQAGNVGTAEKPAGEQRTVLAQHDAVINQRRPGQQVSDALGGIAEMLERQHQSLLNGRDRAG